MTNTQIHAKRELEILAKNTPDALVNEFVPEILALCEAFGRSGQSGFSAPYTAMAITETINKLLLQQNLCPLTGEDSEWDSPFESSSSKDIITQQNNRVSSVFKETTRLLCGDIVRYYNVDAIVFNEEEGLSFTGNNVIYKDKITGTEHKIRSYQEINSFPFTPKKFVIDVVEKDGVSYIKDEKQLLEIFEYYKKEKK